MIGFDFRFSRSKSKMKPVSRLQSFTLPRSYIRLPRREQCSIYAPKSRARTWGPVVFILMAILLAYLSLSHASPPRSRGARPIALGNSYVAEAGDPYSLFYNPAGLAEINQKEFVVDYGRWKSEGEAFSSDFNGLLAFPYRYKDQFFPVAVGLYGEQPAPGASLIDFTVGSGGDAPVEKWTKSFITFPVRLGGAVTVRHQIGAKKSDRIGSSAMSLGLTGGAFIPWSRVLQFGFAIKNLFVGEGDSRGPSINTGLLYRHKGILNMFAELELASGGVLRLRPGLEWLLARGVLRPRLGYAGTDNGGIHNLSTGVGFYLSPYQIDIAYIIPTKTLNDDADQFRASFSYRFGQPQFSEIYYDRALEQASRLDSSVLTLSVKEAEIKESLAEVEQKKRISNEELQNIKSRIEALKEKDLLGEKDSEIRDLRNQVNGLKGQLHNQRQETENLREKKATVRIHVVKPGETLQSIARDYYGDPNQWKKIYNQNPDQIDRGLPKVGAKLVIP